MMRAPLRKAAHRLAAVLTALSLAGLLRCSRDDGVPLLHTPPAPANLPADTHPSNFGVPRTFSTIARSRPSRADSAPVGRPAIHHSPSSADT